MLSRSKTPILQSLYVTLKHKFFSTNTHQKLPTLSKIPAKYRPQAILQAQEVLTEYFHSTRSLPFTFAEYMGKNSRFSLLGLVSKVPFSRNRFPNSIQRFLRLKNGGHGLLGNYVIGSVEDFDEDYAEHLQKIQASRTPFHTLHKLNFLHGIGFGENKLTMKVLSLLHGPGDELQERFDCLLRGGIQFSTLCKMLAVSPKILNQKAEFLEQKLKFLFLDMGLSQEELCAFPSCLSYDLEKRIMPRCQFHKWLREQDWCPYEYSLASIVATSDKMFMARISDIHPDAPKKWFDSFLKENDSISF